MFFRKKPEMLKIISKMILSGISTNSRHFHSVGTRFGFYRYGAKQYGFQSWDIVVRVLSVNGPSLIMGIAIVTLEGRHETQVADINVHGVSSFFDEVKYPNQIINKVIRADKVANIFLRTRRN